MKSIVFIALALAGQMVLAFPKIGDSATFKGLYTGGGGGEMAFTQKLTLVGQNSGGWTLRSELTADNGRQQSDENTVPASDLLSSEQVAEILSICPQAGGALENVTVPAGTFQACAIPQARNSKIWIGNVPFGIVKQIQIDEEENNVTVELESFVFGN